MVARPNCVRGGGFTLVELLVAIGVTTILLVALGQVISLQADFLGQAEDGWSVFAHASAALDRVTGELQSVIQNPEGVTASPAYEVTETSITFRPAIGHIAATDPGYNAALSAGLVSNNGVLYADYTKTIFLDEAERRVKLTATGPAVPPGMPGTLILAENVDVDDPNNKGLRFFDGESTADPPDAADGDEWVIGVRLVVKRPSAAPGAQGSDATSSPAGVALTAKVRVIPEIIFTSQTKPVTGPSEP